MVEELFVTSRDGTRLRVQRRGTGSPIVFVHGSAADASDWFAVAQGLGDRFETNSFDRRGRGGSADGPDYSIEHEVDDVAAVVRACTGPVCLVGHSFGAIVAVLAAARTATLIGSLVLYEPPIDNGVGGDGTALADELDRLVASGRSDDAIAVFVGEAAGSTGHLDHLGPGVRSALRDSIRSTPREIRAASAVLPLDPRLVERVTVPTTVLLGVQQDSPAYAGVASLARDLPQGRLERVPGGHLANLFEPDAVVDVIERHARTGP